MKSLYVVLIVELCHHTHTLLKVLARVEKGVLRAEIHCELIDIAATPRALAETLLSRKGQE